MEIKLTKVIKSRKLVTKEITLEENIKIFYYGTNYLNEDYPATGIVKYIDNEFVIVWDDIDDITKINDSEHSQSVLKYCGF